jgi:TPR repeat protein
MYNLGKLLTEVDTTEAQLWHKRAADTGKTSAMIAMSELLSSTDPAESKRWLESAADLGDPAAMYSLGYLCMETDLHQARRWWASAAAKGYADADDALQKTAPKRRLFRRQ